MRREEAKGLVVDVTVQLPDGTRVRRKRRSPDQTVAGARDYERELIRELLHPTAPRKEVPTLNQYAEVFVKEYARNENRASTVAADEAILRLYLQPVVGRKRLDEIGRTDVANIKTLMRGRELSDKTVRNALGVLSKVLHYAEECELIVKVPRIKLPRATQTDFDFLEFEEAERLLKAAETTQWFSMVHMALKTGLRYGELAELRWGDVDLVAGRILVRRSFYRGRVSPPKNAKEREVPLSPEAVRVLKEARKLRHLDAEALVFCKPDGGRHIHRRADVALKRLCRRADLRSIGWHVLRHTFASHLAMRNVSLKAIQELLGHSDIRMTLRYAHLSPEVRREAVMVLDQASSGQTESQVPPGSPKRIAHLNIVQVGDSTA